MSMPCSVQEIDAGMIKEGYAQMDDFEREMLDNEEQNRRHLERYNGTSYGYYLDNCGDGEWYCEHCLQPDCGKRLAKNLFVMH